MTETLEQIVEDIKDSKNLEIYATIVVGVVVAILGVFGVVSFEIIAAAILATLSLLAWSLLENRRSTSELKDATTHTKVEIASLREAVGGRGSLSNFLSLSDYPDLSAEFERAKSISVLGTTLISTTINYNHEFVRLLTRGGRLRYLLATPNAENAKMLAFRSRSMPTAQAIESGFDASIGRLETLEKLITDPDLLQVRTIPYVQPYGIVVIESIDGRLRAYAKLMAFRTGKLPCLDLNGPADEAWARFFAEQFEELWKAATPLSLPT